MLPKDLRGQFPIIIRVHMHLMCAVRDGITHTAFARLREPASGLEREFSQPTNAF